MPTPASGHDSLLMFGKEASFNAVGTTMTGKVELVSETLSNQIGKIPDNSMYAGRSRRANYQGPRALRGTLNLRAGYEGFMEFARGTLGGYSQSLVETGVRAHVMKEAFTLPSYAFQLVKGNMPAGKCFLGTGIKFARLVVRQVAGEGADGAIQFAVDCVGWDLVSDATITGGGLSFPPLLPMLYHQATVIDDGTADAQANLRIRSVELTVENPLTDDRFYIGSINQDEALPKDFLDVKWKLLQEFNSKTQFEQARAFTAGSPRLLWQHPTTIGTTNKREFEIKSGTATLDDVTLPMEGYGPMLSTATWDATLDPTDASAVVISFKNTEAALT